VAGYNFQALLLLFFKFLRNQPSAMFGVRMLKKAGAQLVAYITVSAVLFIGFAFAAHLVYGPYIYAFSNVLLSAFTLVEISQGIMPEEVRAFDQAGSFIDWILAGVPQTLMISFVFIFWALLTMTLRAIIIDAYAGVLTEIERKAKVVHQHVWWSEDGIGRLHGYIKEMMPHNNFGSILTLLQSRTTQARVYLSHPELVEAIRGACVLMWPLTYVDAICERLNLVALRDALHRQFIADPVVIATHLMSMQSVDVYRVPEVLALLEDALLPKADEGEPTLRAAVRIERAALRSMGVDLDPTGRAPSTVLVEATPQFKVWRAKFAADIERCLDSNASQPGTRASNGAEWDIIAHVDVSRIKIEGLGPVGESAIVSFAVVMRRDADRADVESRLQQSVESVDSCLYDDEVSETTRQLTRAIRFEPGMYDFQVNTGNGLDEITRGLDWCNDTVKGVVVHSMLFAVTKRVLAGRKELREQMTAVKDRQKVVMQRLRDVQHQQRKARWYLEGGTHNFLATPDAATIDGVEGDQDPETVKKIFAAYGAAAKAAAARWEGWVAMVRRALPPERRWWVSTTMRVMMMMTIRMMWWVLGWARRMRTCTAKSRGTQQTSTIASCTRSGPRFGRSSTSNRSGRGPRRSSPRHYIQAAAATVRKEGVGERAVVLRRRPRQMRTVDAFPRSLATQTMRRKMRSISSITRIGRGGTRSGWWARPSLSSSRTCEATSRSKKRW
jgi:hypothetical protein